MPRTMWKGAISFGLVSIPVRVFPATEEKTLRFNQLHDADHGRIRYKRVCAKCGEEVDYDHIIRGYEYEKDSYVVLSDEELDTIPIESGRAIEIEQFVDLDEIDPIYYKKTYYLVPEETGVKAYQLLRQALRDDGRVGIAKVSFRDKEHLTALRLRDDMLVLETMYWPDEIRAADFEEVTKEAPVRAQEVQMARTLIENLTEEWSPERYSDEYREALLELVEKKVEGQEVEVIAPPEGPTAVVDLMDALKQSVEQTKRERKKPAKKSAAKGGAKKKAAS
jgi:DNA end-binding protein Ku